MLTLAIGIHKGGVSKSTITFNLGHELAGSGRRVLLVDADYQADLSSMTGAPESPGRNLSQVMTGARTMRQVALQIRQNLTLAPSDIELANVDAALAHKIGRENILRRALAAVASDYDVCLIDCGPSLGLMTINALAAAGAVLIPLQPTSTDLRALQTFLATINDIRQINPDLQVLGTVLTFYDGRYALHNEAVEALRAANLPIVARIGRTVKAAEATGAHLPLSEYDRDNPQVENFQHLTQAVIQWLQANEQS